MTIDADAILDLIAEEAALDRASISRDTLLVNSGIPSMEFINILFALEDRFGIVVEPDELGGYTTIGDMVDAVLARQAPAERDG